MQSIFQRIKEPAQEYREETTNVADYRLVSYTYLCCAALWRMTKEGTSRKLGDGAE